MDGMMKKRTGMVSVLCWGLTLALQAGPIPLTGTGYTQDFNTLLNSGTLGGGTVPDNAELPAVFFGSTGSGWWNGSGQSFASATSGSLANSSRMLSFGSTDGDSERSIAAGRQGASEAFGAQFRNDTGAAITQLTIQYDGEQWYRGSGGDTLSVFISTDAADLFSGTWTAVPGLSFNAPNNMGVWSTGDGNLPANRATVSDTFSVNIAAGATFFIRFGGDEANDDALAVDNFSITPGSGGGGGPVSGPPFFNTSPTVKPDADSGTAYSESLAADVTEPDGSNTVTFTKLSGPAWLGVAGDGALSGTPSGSDEGLNVFSVEVSDVDGAATGTVHISVIGPVPPPPPGERVDVDVNWNIEHRVGGVSDFGRERHITVHSSLTDPDWNGQEDKLDYLMNDLDVYFGRDNGSASWKFSTMEEDPARPHYVDLSFMTNWLAWWDTQYDANADRLQYENRSAGMIMGHNPHPVYPTLSWNPNGFTSTGWQPLSIEASAEYIVNYLDLGFRRGGKTSGEQLPKYWEVINEPDMLLMTGQFMVSSWEDLFAYHNLVATGVKERMGADAPMIGGMTWGEHDFQIADGISRFGPDYYPDLILGNDPTATNGAEFYRQAGTTQWPGAGDNWDQWDKIWQGFVDHCGTNMDFYSMHIYDWPGRGLSASPGRIRAGGHTEGMLDIMEWYDVHKFGKNNRKPVVVSEFGSVGGYQTASQNGPHIDWECMRSFNSMLMQFLERPDYVVKSLPFTPIKASWGDYSATQRYPYSMLDETSYGNGDWQWTGYIKWYELWADVDGTRIETQASDPDILVDAYVDGDHAFLILNNLETTAANINLHGYGLGVGVDSVRIKHLYCENYADYAGTTAYPVLDDYTLHTAPGSVRLEPEATMILRYNFSAPFTPGATVVETKVFGEKLAPPGQLNPRGGELFRVQGQVFSGHINGVTVPAAPAEAVLRISGSFVESTLTSPRPGLDYIRINGHDLPYLTDWRGQETGYAGGWGQLYTLEVPVPIAYLQADNVVSGQFNNSANRYAAISLQIFDFSEPPGRYGVTANVPVTGVSIMESSISMPEQRTGSLTAVIAPSNATDRGISWTSSNSAVASVDPNTGRITAVAAGSTVITATTADGGFTDSATVTVTPFVPFAVEGVRVNPAQRVILAGKTAPLTATVLPENAANKAVTWSSSNPLVATVDSAGVVTAVAQGSATITATTADGGLMDSSAITVPPPPAVTGVSVDPDTAQLKAGASLRLAAKVVPADAANTNVTWTSLNPALATVDASGLVSALSPGVAAIVVTTDDGGYTATNMTTVIPSGPLLNLRMAGGNLILDAAYGTAGSYFTVFANTNLVAGAGWQPVASNRLFDVDGTASLTNAPGGENQFFYKVEDAGVVSVGSATFDWAETAGTGLVKWDMPVWTETENGLTLTTAGRVTTADGQPYAIKFAYGSHDFAPGTFGISAGGSPVDFVVTSIDVLQAAGTDAGTDKYVRGLLGGVIQWEILPPEDGNMATYTVPTSGDMSLRIDTIEWAAGWVAGAGYPLESKIDNLSIEVSP